MAVMVIIKTNGCPEPESLHRQVKAKEEEGGDSMQKGDLQALGGGSNDGPNLPLCVCVLLVDAVGYSTELAHSHSP